MAAVELRDVVTENDVEAVMALRRGPGKERSLVSILALDLEPRREAGNGGRG
jgi:hypothetical protein